jgi:hypothetical protein
VVPSAAASVSGEGVLGATIMRCVAYVALPVPRLICVEVVELLFPACRQRSMVAVMRIIAVVDVAVKAVRAVKPGAGSNKHPA